MNALAQLIVDRLSDRLGGSVEKYSATSINRAVKTAASETDANPTDAQKEAGNYRKGRFSWNGMSIVIENPAGSVRSGKSKSGHEWSIKMPIHYGYIARTESEADGDAIDVFAGPNPESDIVFVVDQQRGDGGQFDEHKVIIGYFTEQAAKEAYLSCYSSGWKGLKSITPMTVGQFKAWLDEGSSGHPIAGQVSKYAKNRVASGQLGFGFKEDIGQKSFKWDEKKHPRDEGGKFSEAGHEMVTIPEARGVPAFQAEVRNRPDGTAAIHRTEGEGKDRPLATMHGSQVKTFLGDLAGKVTSDTRTNDDSVNKVLDQKAKFISRGNDGLAFDTGDGNVVKAGSDLAYHWSNGIRQPGEGAKRTKEAAELNNKLRAEGVPGLLEQTVIEHDGRTFLKMPKLTIPEKLTRQQLEQVQKTVTELNKRGYAIGDELQPGLDSQGNAHIYDTGSLAKSGQYGIDDDMDHLKRLFEKNGEKFDNPDAGLAYESQFTEVHDHLKRSPRHGVNHWQRMIDRLEEKWKPLDNDTKSFLAESHFTALAQLDARKAEAHARKDESAPLPAPAPEKKPEKKLTAVAGMQQGLFNGGERAGGQKSLFNVVKPSSKDKPTGNSEPKLTGRMADFLAKKDTISPADLAVPLAPKSLPGQKAFFSRSRSVGDLREVLRAALEGGIEKYAKASGQLDFGFKSAGGHRGQKSFGWKEELHPRDAEGKFATEENKGQKSPEAEDQAKKDNQEASQFDPAHAVKVAADGIDELRKQDVYRVVEWTPEEHRRAVSEYISSNRPDLADEVADVSEELGVKPTSEEPQKFSRSQLAEAIRMALSGVAEKYRKQYDPNEEGHWVTIDGNHVFIKDATAGDHARSMGKAYRVKSEHVQHLMPEAHQFLKDQIDQREIAKAHARKLSRLNSGSIAKIENNYRDWSSVDGFDAIARDVALAHPELGFDPDDTDTPGKVWDLIREGKEEYPAADSKEVAELAAKWLKASTPKKKEVYPEDSLPFSRQARGDDPDKYAFREEDHPRDQSGKFAEKDSDDSGRVKMRQAKAGGEVSDIDGKFYKGGHWLPVHGKYSGQEKPAKKPKQEGDSGPVFASESSKGPVMARQLSAEQIEEEKARDREQRDWTGIQSGPLGQLLRLGDRPHNIRGTWGDIRKWAELFEGGEITTQGLEDAEQFARNKIRQIEEEKDPSMTADDWQYYAGTVEENSERDREQYAPRNIKKLLNAHPAITNARTWVSYLLDASQDIGTLKEINDRLSGRAEKYSFQESQHPRDNLGQFTAKHQDAIRKARDTASQKRAAAETAAKALESAEQKWRESDDEDDSGLNAAYDAHEIASEEAENAQSAAEDAEQQARDELEGISDDVRAEIDSAKDEADELSEEHARASKNLERLTKDAESKRARATKLRERANVKLERMESAKAAESAASEKMYASLAKLQAAEKSARAALEIASRDDATDEQVAASNAADALVEKLDKAHDATDAAYDRSVDAYFAASEAYDTANENALAAEEVADEADSEVREAQQELSEIDAKLDAARSTAADLESRRIEIDNFRKSIGPALQGLFSSGVQKYSADKDGDRWITIGGADDGDHKHAGGHSREDRQRRKDCRWTGCVGRKECQ